MSRKTCASTAFPDSPGLDEFAVATVVDWVATKVFLLDRDEERREYV